VSSASSSRMQRFPLVTNVTIDKHLSNVNRNESGFLYTYVLILFDAVMTNADLACHSQTI
jgi:hypothetical protein